MMTSSLKQLLACSALSLGLATGCTRVNTPPPPPTGAALIESIKTSMNGVIATGEGGSGLDSVRFDFERLQTENPEKAKAIEADVKKLLGATTPEARKEAATKIQQQL